MITYSNYINFLKNRNSTVSCYKVELLDDANNPVREITKDILSNGNINIKVNNGIRRTATLTIANNDNKYEIKPGSLFYGTKLRLQVGLNINEEEYYEPVGIFYIQEITPSRGPNYNTITLGLVDKWGRLDGTIYGRLFDRVEFNASLTVYKNTSIIYSNKINSAALDSSEFVNNNMKYSPSSSYPLGSANFKKATSGVNNSLTFISIAAGEVSFPSIKFNYKLSNFSLCFKGNNANSENNVFKLSLNDSLSKSENVDILFYQTGKRGKISINDEEIDLTDTLSSESVVGNPIKSDKKITISYTEPEIVVLFDNKEVMRKEVGLPKKYYLYLHSIALAQNAIANSLTIDEIYMDSTSFTKNYDYNMYEIIRAILKKNIRYDIKVISYLPANINKFSTSEQINEWLYFKMENLNNIRPNLDRVVAMGDGTVFKCSSFLTNTTDKTIKTPVWQIEEIGQSEMLDNVEPILDSYYEPIYMVGTKNEKGVMEYSVGLNGEGDYVQIYGKIYKRSILPFGLLTLPFSLTEERGTTESSIILSLVELLSAEVGYNRYGQFFLKPTEREINYEEQEVIWRFAYYDYYFSKQESINYSNIINCVVITSNITDGEEITEYVMNENPESEFCIQKIGTIPFIYKLNYSYDPQAWIPEGNEDKTEEDKKLEAIKSIRLNMRSLAEWYLSRNQLLQSSVNITCPLIPHLEEGKIIELENKDNKYEKYLINSFTIPINYSGVMSINCTKVG